MLPTLANLGKPKPEDVEPTVKPKPLSPYEVTNSITIGRVPFTGEQLTQASNVMYVVMRGLAYDQTLTQTVNMFNKRSMTGEQQYLGLFNAVPKKRRYIKWPTKGIIDQNIINIKEYYRVSERVALMYNKLLTPNDLDIIADATDKGGVGKKRKLRVAEKKAREAKKNPIVKKEPVVEYNPLRAFFS